MTDEHPSMDHDPLLRAGDADRDAVVERLHAAHAEGRLTTEELTERLDAALAARTLGDLLPLTSDLPVPAAELARTGDEARVDRPDRNPERSVRAACGAWATAVLVCTAIWLAVGVSSGFGYCWPIWVAGPWGAVLLARTLFGR